MSSGVRQIRLDDIAVVERVGFYHPEHAAGLAESIKLIGLQSPIHVRRNGNRAEKPWRLVAGLHRLRACELLGWSGINAIQVAGESSDAAELLRLELSENLDHRRPRPIERALFVAARARLEEGADYPDSIDEPSQVRAAKARWNKAEENQPDNASAVIALASRQLAENHAWRQRTANSMGMGLRSLSIYLGVYRAIIAPFPDLAEPFNRHDAAQSLTALKKLADFGAEAAKKTELAEQVLAKRRAVIELLLEPGNEAMTIEEAITVATGRRSKGAREATEDNRWMAGALGQWRKLPIAQKERFAVSVVDEAPKRVLYAILRAIEERELRDGKLASRQDAAG